MFPRVGAGRYIKTIIFLIFLLVLAYVFSNFADDKHFSKTKRNSGNSRKYLFTQQRNKLLKKCPLVSPFLSGPLNYDRSVLSLEEIELLYPSYELGGHYVPNDCVARYKTAIIVPYKERQVHLRIFLHNLHSFLQRQQLDYAIFIIEPMGNDTFNRAKLMNIGYLEALLFYPFECFVFHDVDLIPLDDRIPYTCQYSPAHLSRAIDKFSFTLPYSYYFGGVCSFTKDDYRLINGASNKFWGWGGEDDELFMRVTYAGLNITRPLAGIGRYKMLKHVGEKSNPVNNCRYQILKQNRRGWRKDGLNLVRYKTLSIERKPTFTHIKVDLKEKRSKFIEKTIRCHRW